MKKISIAVNIVLISIIMFMACNTSSSLTSSSTASKSCVDCTNDAFYGLTVDDFVKGVARYRKTHWDKINSDPYMLTEQKGMQDARACWYSVDTLKKFICLIEKYSKSLGLPADKLGIRFYYATYPYKGVWKPEYISHHTLFMVPTYSDERDDNIDFDPRYNVKTKKKLQPLSQIGKDNFSTQLLVLDGTTSNAAHVTAKNQGQLCPPTCPRVTGNIATTTNMMEYVDDLYPTGIDWTY